MVIGNDELGFLIKINFLRVRRPFRLLFTKLSICPTQDPDPTQDPEAWVNYHLIEVKSK